eukprot:17786-Chlamydomonas_euryale.AAC.3
MPKYNGLLTVTEVVGKGACKFELLSTLSRLHSVFNVCLLKPYRDDGRTHPPGPAVELDFG